jgi:hypothetical protein
MRVAPRFAIASLLFVASSMAQAATLHSIEGDVMINRGDGYEFARAEVDLDPGHHVIVSPTGSAQILYADGCNVTALPGTIVPIKKQSPCSIETGAIPAAPAIGLLIPLAAGGAAGGAYLLSQKKDQAASP